MWSWRPYVAESSAQLMRQYKKIHSALLALVKKSADLWRVPIIKSQWCRTLMFSLMLVWTYCWVSLPPIWDAMIPMWCHNNVPAEDGDSFEHAYWDIHHVLLHARVQQDTWRTRFAAIPLGWKQKNRRCTSLIHSARTEMADHYSDVMMGAMASKSTSLTIVYSTVCSDQRKHQGSASLVFVRGIYRWLANSPCKWSVTRKFFSFDDVIMIFQTTLSDAF